MSCTRHGYCVARLAPEGGAVQVEVTGDGSSGGAELLALLPTDAALGTWTAERRVSMPTVMSSTVR